MKFFIPGGWAQEQIDQWESTLNGWIPIKSKRLVPGGAEVEL